MINRERYEVVVSANAKIKSTLEHQGRQYGYLLPHDAECLHLTEVIENNLKYLFLENTEDVIISKAQISEEK